MYIPSKPALLGAALMTSSAMLFAESGNDQAGADGFVEGQSLYLTTRNFAAREWYRDSFSLEIPKRQGPPEATQARHTLVQGTQLGYRSGYTEGEVGVGLDLAAFNAINLERGKGRISGGGNRTLTDSDGHAPAQWTKVGIANLRLRASSTELKAGRFLVDTPVFGYIDNRALPSSFDGVALDSQELDTLHLQAGSFRRVSPRTGAGDEAFTTEYGTREAEGDRVHYLGGRYGPVEALEVAVYGGRFEDIWDQFYLGLFHGLGDRDTLALDTALNAYRTRDSGSRKAGYIDNDAWSLAFTLSHKAHALSLAWQQVRGDEYFDYVHETGAIHLANSLFSDYNGPNEKSVQISYRTDWDSLGIPGLDIHLWYVKGWDIDGTRYTGDRNGAFGNYAEVRAMDGERHHEYGLSASYRLREGQLKDATFKVTWMSHRGSRQQVDGSADELRIVTTLPFSLL
jgi:hypothetical protein